MSTKTLGGNTRRPLSQDLEDCLKTYKVNSQDDRPQITKGRDVGLIVASTVGLGLLVFIAVMLYILASLPV